MYGYDTNIIARYEFAAGSGTTASDTVALEHQRTWNYPVPSGSKVAVSPSSAAKPLPQGKQAISSTI